MSGGPSLELGLALQRGAGPLRSQLEDSLRRAVHAGALAPGTALPSTRGLARDLGISRGVVVEAYDQLVAEGYLVSRQGAPTRVAQTTAGTQAGAAAIRDEAAPRFDFRPGGPDLALFPRARWLTSLRRALRDAPDARLDYGDPRGAPELRAALAAYLGRVRGVACGPDDVVVTSGMAQGMALLGRVLVARGCRQVALEEPSSAPGRAQLAAVGLEPVPVPVDEHGLCVEQLGVAGAAVVTPAHQFPTGVVLTPERRTALAGWARAHEAYVLEDDYDAEYRYDRQPVGALQGLAPDRVVYAGTGSTTLAPGLRRGWLVVPPSLGAAIAEGKASADLGTPVVEQLALADFLARGELDRHLRRTRQTYRARRDALIAALARHLPAARPTGAAAGLHIVVGLPARTDEPALLAAARAHGIALSGLSEHALAPGLPALLLGYGRIATPAIDVGVRALAAAAAGVR